MSLRQIFRAPLWSFAAAVSILSLNALSVAGGQIQWRGGTAELPAMNAREIAAVLEAAGSDAASAQARAQHAVPLPDSSESQQGGGAHVVVQFSQAVDPALRAQLAAGGLDLLAYLGDHAFFAAVDAARLNAAAVAAAAGIESVQPIALDWKLDPMFVAGEHPEWAIVDGSNPADPVIGAYVLFHSDVPFDAVGIPLVTQRGGIVRSELWSINGLVVELPYSEVFALAAEDGVQWIEPPLPQMSELNDSNRAITQANTVQAAPYGLTGAGVNVLVYDGGTARATHQDFGGRLFVRDASGMASHATHVSGTIGGSGAASGGAFKGMAPGVTIQSYGFQSGGGDGFLYSDPGDIQNDYNEAVNTFGAVIANNSIGNNTEPNGFDCARQGNYGVTDVLIDNIVRGSLGAPLRIVWADGNERQGDRCDIEGFGDYYSTAPPATAKNHVTVGALNSNDDSMTSFSSWGPTDDGRMKPDISAPGCQSNGDFGVTSCTSSGDTSYGASCGTSMASPTVCGLSSLLLQDFRAQFPALPDFRNSTLRILLAQTAQDRGNAGPDYQFGYGSVRIKDAIDFMRLGRFTELPVQSRCRFTVEVAPGTAQLKVMIAWDDAPGTPNVVPALVNDLDLQIFDPSDNQHFPWTLNPANPSAAAVRTAANHRDNIEQVLVTSPVAGTWRVEIKGFNVPQGPQTVSICSSEALVRQPSIDINFPNGLPAFIAPGATTNIDVQITPTLDTVTAGSPTAYFRYNAGTFLSAALIPIGGDLYHATLPPPVCGATPEFYFTAEGAISGIATSPENAPASQFHAIVRENAVITDDRFETNSGWTAGAAGDNAADGLWERVDPQPTTAQPGDDHSPNGVICWVTNGTAGPNLNSNDVDSGSTTLTSNVYDLSTYPEATISYWRWFFNTSGQIADDTFRIQISSDNGGAWTAVETLGPNGFGPPGAWINHQFRVADIIAPTAQVRLRFIASDLFMDRPVEAAIDDLLITSFGCWQVLADCNHNGIVDGDDISSGRSQDVNSNSVPDECESLCSPCDTNCDGSISLFDIAGFVDLLSGAAPVGCSPCAGDTTEDGSLNQFDIQPFVDCLTGP